MLGDDQPLQLVPHGQKLLDNIQHRVDTATEMHARAPEQSLRPLVPDDDLIRQNHLAAVLDRKACLGSCTAVLSRLYHHRCQPVARHGGITHQEVLLLWWGIRPELGKYKPARSDLLLQSAIFSRVLRIQDGDKPTALSVPAADLARCRLWSDLFRIGDERGRYEAVPNIDGATCLQHLRRQLGPAQLPRTRPEERYERRLLLETAGIHRASVRARGLSCHVSPEFRTYVQYDTAAG